MDANTTNRTSQADQRTLQPLGCPISNRKGQLRDVMYGLSTGRVGEGHVAQDDPLGRPGMNKAEIIDRLCWLKEQGVTMSSVPIPAVRSIDEYCGYTQWVAEEIMPAIR